MVRTVAQLLPFAIGGAFLPTWTSHVILLLRTERPVATASAYVGGNAIWRLVLGFAAIFVVSVTAPEQGRQGVSIPVGVAWTIAALLAATGAWLLARRSKADGTEAKTLPKWIGRFKRFPPWAAFGFGVYNCATPGSQWVYFLGGCGVIASAGLAWEWRIVLLVVFVAVLEVMLVAPIIIYARRREEATAGFARLDRWLARHAATVVGGILVMLGALFVYIALAGGQVGGTR